MTRSNLLRWIRGLTARIAACAGVLFAGCRSLPSPEDWAPPALDGAAFAREVERVRLAHGQPALAAAVLRSGGEVRSAVSGTLVRGETSPALPRHRFHAGSTTKSFTAVLAAQLVEEGRLDWETTLGEALPDVPMREEHRPVTVRDLLLGASGLLLMQRADLEPAERIELLFNELPKNTPDPLEQRRQFARYALAQPPLHARGSRHQYSNAGWALLGHLLEVRTGRSFEQLMQERIFDVLGMSGARVGGWPASPEEPDQPRGHYVEVAGLRPQPLDDPYRFPAWLNPAGGVHLTIDDFAAWAREHLRGLRGEGRLLPAAAYQRIHSPQLRVRADEMYVGSQTCEELALGLGWAVVEAGGYPLSAADGSGGTFYARLAVLPSHDVAFAALVNSGAGEPVLSEAIRALLGLPW